MRRRLPIKQKKLDKKINSTLSLQQPAIFLKLEQKQTIFFFLAPLLFIQISTAITLHTEATVNQIFSVLKIVRT